MKTITLCAAVLCCSVFTAAETLEQPHVTVYGTAEIKVVPNEMIWSLNVKSENDALPTVAANHTATVAKVLEFLKSLKIDEKKLQTSRMHFGENWKYINRENVKVGYYASTDIGFTISDLDLYQKLWFALAGFEGVSIQTIQYDHSDRIRLQNESRQKALLAAREKADSLAKTLGSQIGEPLSIEETSPQTFPQPLYSNRAMQSDMGGSVSDQAVALGQISISTKVLAVFKLKNP